MGDAIPARCMSVHQSLGGGSVADVLLWKKWGGSAVLLMSAIRGAAAHPGPLDPCLSATAFWFLFERAGYNLLTFVANVLLLLVGILFFWAKSASLLNRPLPPLPDLEISEETVTKAASVIQVYVNYALSIARDIVIGRDVKMFLQVASGLWVVVSYIGSLFNFITLVYVGVLLSLSVPFVYDKYQHHIDEKLSVANKVIKTQYRKIDDTILKKLPLLSNKEKKVQ